MAHCINCGIVIDKSLTICPECGAKQQRHNKNQDRSEHIYDESNFGWLLLGILLPPIGLILYFIWRGHKPNTAEDLGAGSLITILIAFSIWVVTSIIGLF